MFKKLVIQNFQSHKKTTLEFSEGVNIIVGQTDSGKSAIIRALRWLIWNQPSGNEFRSTWGGTTRVRLIDMDGNEIIREEGDERLYTLNDSEFRAFRTDVPEEIKKVLNMSDVNLQQQLDSVFLLSQTAGEVAKHFNRIANLEKIALSQSNIKKWINSLNSSITFAESELKKNEQQLQQYNDLDKYEADIEVLEEKEKQLKQIQKQVYSVKDIITSIEDAEQEIEENLKLSELKADIDSIYNLKEQLSICQSEKKTLSDIVYDIEDCDEYIQELKQLILLKDIVNNVLSKIAKYKDIKSQIKILSDIVTSLEYQNDKIVEWGKQEILLKKQFDEEMGDVCILCGSSLTHKH